MITTHTPLLLLQEAAAGTAASDSASVMGAALGGGNDVAVMITLGVILVAGVAVLFAGDRVRRSDEMDRARRAGAGDGLAH